MLPEGDVPELANFPGIFLLGDEDSQSSSPCLCNDLNTFLS